MKDALKKKGMFVKKLSNQGEFFRKRWEHKFASALSASQKKKIYMDQFLWHAFSNKIDMIAHNMAQNAERKKKFLFNDETYNYSPLYVTVPKNRNDIHSLKDLEGKKMIVGATSNAAVYLDKYNQKHSNKIDVVYAGQGADDATTQLKTGRVDATLATPFSIDFSNQALKFQQKTVGDIVINSKVYFMFNKKDEKLKSEVDQAIKKLKKDGTLKKLSTKWLGEDYTVQN
ncbi:DUF4275 family protein [Priestia aryabhattai]|uniref:DUF4275 family protein n=1 Tax=Priestia aryabhattai TaxID=412384 RepID=UPI001EC0A305|nr:DUF4275 family protein [Priestia aryabhattai]MBU3568933.1 DUF4275 family protein [Priestia aryabhattai]WDL89722.1 DUF4275 family protein [Priestia aryabhattai]